MLSGGGGFFLGRRVNFRRVVGLVGRLRRLDRDALEERLPLRDGHPRPSQPQREDRAPQPVLRPRVLILHANGTNRDHDAALACQGYQSRTLSQDKRRHLYAAYLGEAGRLAADLASEKAPPEHRLDGGLEELRFFSVPEPSVRRTQAG